MAFDRRNVFNIQVTMLTIACTKASWFIGEILSLHQFAQTLVHQEGPPSTEQST